MPLFEETVCCVFSSEDGCGQSDLGPQSGLLSSKNYPDEYPNNSSCEWKIRVHSSLRIVLKFEDVSIEGVDCETDYLKVLKENHGTTFGKRTVFLIRCDLLFVAKCTDVVMKWMRNVVQYFQPI